MSEVSMRSLLLHPTSIAQWQGLIHEAQKNLSIALNTELEAYLVFLLMRFMQQPEVAHSVLGLDFLEGTQHIKANQIDLLRNVGDKCLLFAGLFPDRAYKRRVSQYYFIKLGKSAYLNLSENSINSQQATLFATLCTQFLLLTDILQATREISQPNQDLMQVIERWHTTGSSLSLQHIQKATQGLPSLPHTNNDPKKFAH
ncbi:MAG: hypothetical protein AB7D28_09950 [Candidatus Berkiella sp.]